MSEASGGGSSRAEMERRLVEKSLQDDDFRQRLLADPKGTVEQELGTPLPEGVQIQAVEETSDTIYLVLPSSQAGSETGERLSDRDLESVAGGGSSWGGCDDTSQSGTCTCGCPPGRR